MNARLYRYQLPLLRPFPRSSARVACGYVVALANDRYGEVSDMALVGGETPQLVELQLREAIAQDGKVNARHCPPVRWALSSAQSDTVKHSGNIVLNALLDASDIDVVDQAMALHTQGYRCFKIKIGDAQLNDEISRISELTKVLGKGIVLRLDGNRKLTLPGAVEFARALKKVTIAYFEEPFADLASISEFHRLTGFTIALDETVLTCDFEKWCSHEAVSAYVVKPSRIGDVSDVCAIVRRAQRYNKECVLSSTFESGIGIMALAKQALFHEMRTVPMGLATGTYFAADLLTPALRPFRGQMMLSAMHSVNVEESVHCQRLV